MIRRLLDILNELNPYKTSKQSELVIEMALKDHEGKKSNG